MTAYRLRRTGEPTRQARDVDLGIELRPKDSGEVTQRTRTRVVNECETRPGNIAWLTVPETQASRDGDFDIWMQIPNYLREELFPGGNWYLCAEDAIEWRLEWTDLGGTQVDAPADVTIDASPHGWFRARGTAGSLYNGYLLVVRAHFENEVVSTKTFNFSGGACDPVFGSVPTWDNLTFPGVTTFPVTSFNYEFVPTDFLSSVLCTSIIRPFLTVAPPEKALANIGAIATAARISVFGQPFAVDEFVGLTVTIRAIVCDPATGEPVLDGAGDPVQFGPDLVLTSE